MADPDSVISLLFSDSTKLIQDSELVFRFEPLIIAVECRDLSSAQSLVSLAIACGFRESGITNVSKRVIVGIRCSIRLEVPLGDTQNIMVSEYYLRFLVGVANEKMEANWKRTEGFLRAFLKSQDGTMENAAGSECSVSGGDCNEGQDGLERSFGDAQVGKFCFTMILQLFHMNPELCNYNELYIYDSGFNFELFHVCACRTSFLAKNQVFIVNHWWKLKEFPSAVCLLVRW